MKQNPKHIRAQKDGKIPYDRIPWEVLEDDAWVHAFGANRYGERNWLVDKILASTYEGAMMRHLMRWIMGEDIDPESGRPHLSHLRACAAIVLSSQKHGTFIDDRDRKFSKGVEHDDSHNQA